MRDLGAAAWGRLHLGECCAALSADTAAVHVPASRGVHRRPARAVARLRRNVHLLQHSGDIIFIGPGRCRGGLHSPQANTGVHAQERPAHAWRRGGTAARHHQATVHASGDVLRRGRADT